MIDLYISVKQEKREKQELRDAMLRERGGEKTSNIAEGEIIESNLSTLDPRVVCDDELSFEDEQDRLKLEREIERAFYKAGCALKELRDRRLYRSTHKTFQEYCQDRFGFTRRRSDYLISAAEVVDNLSGEPEAKLKREPMVLILPTSERQCRPLTKLEPEQQREIWHKAVETSKGKVPSGKVVSALVAEIEGKPISDKRKIDFSNKNESYRQLREGINYKQGMGCEFYVRVSQETWEKLNKYAEYVGTATLSGAVARLLNEVNM
jgi:hypothetical protein